MYAVTQREWMWALAVAVLIVTVSTLPYAIGYAAQTPHLRFSGAVMDQADYRSHLAKMWQGYRGQWRYRLLFTPEEHQGAYLQGFYVALGHTARLARLSLPVTYHVARVTLGLLMLLVIYRFVAHFVTSVRTRRVAFLLATTASGLGWFTEMIAPTPVGGVSPMDFWLLDGFTYLAVLTSPHFCLAIALLLGIAVLLLRRPEGPSWEESGLAALLSVALGVIHPYMLLVADLLPLLYWSVGGSLWRRPWRRLRALAAMGALQMPLLAYDLWVFRTRPVFAGWSVQNVTHSPSPWIYLCGYGLVLALGLIGALTWERQGGRHQTFLLLWIAIVAVLVYLPWNLQRRFLEGVQVPLGLLGGVGLVHLSGSVARVPRRRWLVQVAVISLAAMSNLYITAGLSLAAGTRAQALFWNGDSLTAIHWLGEHTSWEETVLAGPRAGSLIPAVIGHRVVVGHGMETVEYEEKRMAVNRFFSADTSDAERLALVRKWGVRWIFHGPQERELGEFNPESASWLTPAFRSDGVTVYRVSLAAGEATESLSLFVLSPDAAPGADGAFGLLVGASSEPSSQILSPTAGGCRNGVWEERQGM